jgi:rubrerythrin
LKNLKEAFAGESMANRRYLYFARRADIEGYPDIGGLFRDTSEAETGHAFGHKVAEVVRNSRAGRTVSCWKIPERAG